MATACLGLHNTYLRYTACGTDYYFSYVILPERCSNICMGVQHSYLIYSLYYNSYNLCILSPWFCPPQFKINALSCRTLATQCIAIGMHTMHYDMYSIVVKFTIAKTVLDIKPFSLDFHYAPFFYSSYLSSSLTSSNLSISVKLFEMIRRHDVWTYSLVPRPISNFSMLHASSFSMLHAENVQHWKAGNGPGDEVMDPCVEVQHLITTPASGWQANVRTDKKMPVPFISVHFEWPWKLRECA